MKIAMQIATDKGMNNILTPPTDREIHEGPTSIYWFDDDGILCSIHKKGTVSTPEQSRQIINEFREKTNNQKFCILMDITNAPPSDKEGRELAAEEFPKIVKAMAILTASPMGRVLATMFFAIKPTPYPSKMFAHEKDAKEWLKQYL